MRVTIVDIAKATGVSRTTVSNVLNGVYKCTEETKDKILSAAKEMGYRPNIAAKTLVKNTSNLIGIIFPAYVDKNLLTGNPFYNLIIDGINATLSEIGLYDLLINCITQKQSSDKLIDWIRMRNIDGLIIVGEIENEILEDIEKEQVPMVLIDNYAFQYNDSQKVLFVNIEDEKGAYMGTEHLIKKSYKNIGFCSSHIGSSSINKFRYFGYKKALKNDGLNENLFEIDNIFFEEGVRVAKKFVENNIDSVVCTSDIVALGIVKGLSQLGKKVPEDMAVVGFDNLDICAQFIPALTTINQNIFEKGKISVELLLEIIKSKIQKNNKIIMPVNLVERETT